MHRLRVGVVAVAVSLLPVGLLAATAPGASADCGPGSGTWYGSWSGNVAKVFQDPVITNGTWEASITFASGVISGVMTFDSGQDVVFPGDAITGTYDFEFGSDYTSHTGQGTVRWTF